MNRIQNCDGASAVASHPLPADSAAGTHSQAHDVSMVCSGSANKFPMSTGHSLGNNFRVSANLRYSLAFKKRAHEASDRRSQLSAKSTSAMPPQPRSEKSHSKQTRPPSTFGSLVPRLLQLLLLPLCCRKRNFWSPAVFAYSSFKPE